MKMSSTSDSVLTKRRMNVTSWCSWFFLVLTVLSAIACTEARNHNRLYGPMIGKRTQGDSSNFETDEMFGFNVPEDSQKAETEQYDFRPSTACTLDALFMQLTPEWQKMVIKMMRQARYKS